MQGLLLRLSSLDADAESAVRLISFFDSLIEQHVDVTTLVLHTAMLAACTAGFEDRLTHTTTSASHDGTAGSLPCPPGAASRTLHGGHVAWIARAGTAALRLDQLLLDVSSGATSARHLSPRRRPERRWLAGSSVAASQ